MTNKGHKYLKFPLIVAQQNKHSLKTDGFKLPLNQIKNDFGAPQLSESFFCSNPLKTLSVECLIYNMLIQTDMRKMYTKKFRAENHRADKERKAIMQENRPEKLMEFLCNEPDPLNHEVLTDKILQHESVLVPQILEKLISKQNETFLEVSLYILYEARQNWMQKLESVLLKIQDPYALSLMCVMLGLKGSRSSIPLVWRAFHVLKKMRSKYINGPLLALEEFKDRCLIE